MKTSFKNRNNLDIVVGVFEPNREKIIFIMHGLGGFKEQAQIIEAKNTFAQLGFTVITFDTTNTYGESGGKYEEATTGQYYTDLEDVMNWSKSQDWYSEPFALCGFSLGGFAVIKYAAINGNKVLMSIPVAPVISGEQSLSDLQKYTPEKYESWKNSGWREEKSESKPGLIKRLPWSHMEERLQHNLYDFVSKIEVPILFVMCENDSQGRNDSIVNFYDKVPSGLKRIATITNAPHTMLDSKNLEDFSLHLTEYYALVQKSNKAKNTLRTEGFPIVYDWHDKRGTVYESHAHQGKVSFYVIEGSVSFSGGIQRVVSTGERFDVPKGIEHSAKVGEFGCQYVVGQEIEGDA